jgi:hypothetical protein
MITLLTLNVSFWTLPVRSASSGSPSTNSNCASFQMKRL